MANFKKKSDGVEEVVEGVSVDKTESAKPVMQKKTFKDSDLIPCKSITQGEMFFQGSKSGILYQWGSADDVTEIEFRDLNYAIRSKDKMMLKPRFIVMDDDFIKLFPVLDELYASLYSISDLKDILFMQPNKMEKIISSLPQGAKESLKSVAMTQIRSGKLDSVNRIKKLDELFNTNMLTLIM